MLLVVWCHVMGNSFDLGSYQGYNSPWEQVITTFRMPLFFFVSGFFAFKMLDKWTLSFTKSILVRKFKVQIVGALLFLTLFYILSERKLPGLEVYTSQTMHGYWFTIALLKIYLGYMAVSLLSIKIGENFFWVVMTSIALLCIIITMWYRCDYDSMPQLLISITYYIHPQPIEYLPYFVLGLATRRFLPLYEKVFGNTKTMVSILIIMVLLWCYIIITDMNVLPLKYPLGIIGVAAMLSIFYVNRDFFSKKSKTPRALTFIGRRTLDIYFLHYFFIPNLMFMTPYLIGPDRCYFQALAGLIITVLIVPLCLGIGSVLRKDPQLGSWLFGAKLTEKTSEYSAHSGSVGGGV